MTVQVLLKSPANITRRVEAHPLILKQTPTSPRALIAEAVRTSVAAYRARAAAYREDGRPQALPTDTDWTAMAELGRFAFGLQAPASDVDLAAAIDTATQAYADGLVRILHGDTPLGDLDTPLTLRENDTLTFVRLTMLSGRMW